MTAGVLQLLEGLLLALFGFVTAVLAVWGPVVRRSPFVAAPGLRGGDGSTAALRRWAARCRSGIGEVAGER